MTMATTRRLFLGGSGSALLALKFGAVAQASQHAGYRRSEDVMRNKWTWDRVARGTHGTNCTGNCAFNVFVRNGIVWREEQQGEYQASTADTPDYGPRGCNKGLRHAKYMYGKQRVLYPMKRVGERGAGRWERISWEQAATEIADRFIDYNVAHGPRSISTQLGTAMVLKRASFAALGRFATIAGTETPEAFAGVGDLPTGTYMTVGVPLISDTMAAVYKSRYCLIWYCNPAVTRIPDAHFFWEARYNGTEVVAISPEFTPTSMHASKWVNPLPGTDSALALSMVQVIIAAALHKPDYIREQTDLPFLVRTDNGKFLRESDMSASEDARANLFYVFDESTGEIVAAPGTGGEPPPPGSMEAVIPSGSLNLGSIRPALEGAWMAETTSGPVQVTTVFARLREHLNAYTPELVTQITGVSTAVIRQLATSFAEAETAMIFSGYRVSKWLHGDLMQRAFMLLLAVTGNFGKPGTGLQIWNMPKEEDQFAFMFADLPPTLRIATMSRWDYAKADLKSFNKEIYGQAVADQVDKAYQESIDNGWFPDYSEPPWKMGMYFGSNAANWRSSGKRWREEAFEKLETIVVATPDMGVTAMYADYVLPVAHHYERQDFMLEPRTPYAQVLDAAVPPLGESRDDFAIYNILAEAISRRATERNIAPIDDNFMGLMPVQRDLRQYHALFTMGGKIRSNKDVAQFLLNLNEGIPEKSFDELARKGIVRNNDSDGVMYGEHSPYGSVMLRAWEQKTPYPTLTGRQQYYIDHDWFIAEGEALPSHKGPLKIDRYPLTMLMGHARHGIHSMWRDDPFLLSLQRGEPDIYVSVEDAATRGITDGDLIRVFNNAGHFIAIAHVSSSMQPGVTFMYHGWDPMMFRERQNFGAVVACAGLIKATSLVSGYGHITYRPLAFEPNAIFNDFTCDFEKYAEAEVA